LLLNKSRLLVGVSALATLVANPGRVFAENQAWVKDHWSVWFEGGATALGGADAYVPGFASPGIHPGAQNWGWEIAAGLDYRFDPVWHFDWQFRYGENRVAAKPNNANASFLVSTDGTFFSPVGVAGSGYAARIEDHWLADFMIGRDMNLGMDRGQFEAGVRIASITGNTTGAETWLVPKDLFFPSFHPPLVAANYSFVQYDSFLGAGPRFARQGSIALGGAWSFDYNTGVALLFGDRKFSQSVTISGPNMSPCLAGCPVNASGDSFGAVFNFDAQPGISYAIDRHWKLTGSYRFDGYWDGMRIIDSNNNAVNVTRYYQGIFLRVTYTWY
jgi:hypothetical protein